MGIQLIRLICTLSLIVLFVCMSIPVPQQTLAQVPDAVVKVSNLRIRVRPSTARSSAVLDLAPRGTQVTLLARNKNGDWFCGTTSTGITGWMAKLGLRINAALDIAKLPDWSVALDNCVSAIIVPTAVDRRSGTPEFSTDIPPTPESQVRPTVRIFARCSTEAGNLFDLVIEGGGGAILEPLNWQQYKNGSPAGEPSGTLQPPIYSGTHWSLNEYAGYTFGIRISGGGAINIVVDYAEIDCSGQS